MKLYVANVVGELFEVVDDIDDYALGEPLSQGILCFEIRRAVERARLAQGEPESENVLGADYERYQERDS